MGKMSRNTGENKEKRKSNKDSTELFRVLAEHALVGVYLIQDNVFKYVNPKLAEIFGYTPDELIEKKGPRDLTYCEDRALVKENIRKRISGEVEHIHYSFRGLKKNGEVFDAEVFGSRVIYKGKPAVIGTLLDITERKRAEEALKESEEKYRKLLETANDAIFIADAETGIILDTNKKAEKLLGIPKEEIIGMHQSQLHPKEEVERYKAIFKEHVKKGRALDYRELYVVRKDGQKIPVEISASVIKIRGKKIVLGIFRDITERKRAEEALKESEEKYRAIFENTGTATTIVEEDTTISLANQEFEKLSGYTKEEIERKKSWTEFVLKEDLERMKKYHRLRRVNPDAAPRKYEFRFIDKKGNVKDVLLTIDMIPGTKKSIASLLDITKLKQTERALQKRLEMEKTLAELSERLVKAKRIGSAVNKALSQLGEVFDADRVLLFQKKEGKDTWSSTHEWRRKGMQSVKEKLQGISLQRFPWWEKKVKNYKPIVICDLNKLPREAKSVLKIFKTRNTKSFLAVPILIENKLAGLIALCSTRECRTWEEVDTHILQAAGEIILTCLAKERLQKRLARTLKSLEIERKRMEELAKRTIEAQEKERLYLASEIHDNLIQGLVATSYYLQTLDVPSSDKKLKERKETLIEVINASIQSGRELIKHMEPIREPEIGLIQAIKKSIDLRFAESGIEVKFTHPPKLPPLELTFKTNILRIVQEALMNVRRHAQASKVSIKVSSSKDKLKIEIKDDGVGFDVEKVSKSTEHFGLLAMEERAKLVRGKITIKSKPGKGTTIKGVFPLKVAAS
jgi:PAS domain S-box-containing protein